MVVLDFVIPCSKDELLEPSNDHYYVRDEVTESELNEKIKECFEELHDDGPVYILKQFDTLYGLMTNFKTIDYNVLHKVYTKLLLKSLTEFNTMLNTFLNSDEEMNDELLDKYTNSLKMTLYIITEFINNFENRLQKDYHKIVIDARARKVKIRASIKHREKFNWDWDFHLSNGLNLIHQLLKMKIQKLWDPPIVEEEFVNMIGNCCYKILEDPCISGIKHKELRIFIFQVIGYLIKRYNHGISCTVKIVQLLKNYEHLVSPLAQAVVMFIRMNGCKSLVREIVREISDIEDASENSGGESSKMIANFLNEVAAEGPEYVLPAMEELLLNLEKDSYLMRNCTLTILSELLINVYKREDLNEDAKEQRDEYMNALLDHIHDCNTFVRSKVLQLLQKLVLEKAIPVSFTSKLLDRTILRLMDKSSNVVKYAIQLLKTMIESNPFAAKLGVEELKKKILEAQNKLEELKANATEDPVYLSLVDEWSNVHEPAMYNIIPGLLEEDHGQDKENDHPNEIQSSDTSENTSTSGSVDTDVHYTKIKSLISQHKYEEAFVETKKLQQIVMGDSHAIAVRTMPPEEQVVYTMGIFRKIFVEYKGPRNEQIKILTSGTRIEVNEAHQDTIPYQKLLLTFLKDSLEFAEKITKCIPVMCQLMLSKSPSEQLEAIEFFRSAYQFGMTDAEPGVREMLALVKAKDKNVKEAVIKAYTAMYLLTDHRNPRSHSMEVIKRLCSLVKSVHSYQKSAVEELIKEWVISGAIDRECILILWEIFTKKLPEVTSDHSKVALIIIAMVSGAQLMTAKSNVDVLIDLGLGEQDFDCQRVAYVCQIFLKLEQEGTRYPNDHKIFTRLVEILVQNFALTHDQFYPVMAVEAINVIYKLAKAPDQLCTDLLKNLYAQIKMREEPETEPDSQPLSQQSSKEHHLGMINADLMTNFLTVFGHIAARQMYYLDKDILVELKKRNAIEVNKLRSKSTASSTASSTKKGSKNRPSGISTPLLGGISTPSGISTPNSISSRGSADDTLANGDIQDVLIVKDEESNELIRQTCDDQLLNTNLLNHFTQTLIFICRNLKKYNSKRLKSVAALTLSKLMFISLPFCDKNLQLFVTIMEKSPDPNVRINLLIGFGDLICRFPNLVEPWTDYLFNILKDRDITVRLNALLTVSKLISNEMVKVKAYVSEVALLIVDKDENISQRAVDLFEEIAQKGSSLYNVLMDIILRLSTDIDPINEDDFQIIMKIIINLVNHNKEKNFENLIEKILVRLRGAEYERQWRDITYCLTLFNYNEACLNKLIDNFDVFKERIKEPTVLKNMIEIVSGNNTKFARPTIKELQNDLKNKLDAATNNCAVIPSNEIRGDNEEPMEVDDMITSTPANPSQSTRNVRRPKETPVKAPQSASTKRSAAKQKKKRIESSDEEEEDDDDEDGEEDDDFQEKNLKKPSRSQGKSARNKKSVPSSDEEDDAMEGIEEDSVEDEDPQPPPSKPKGRSTRSRR